MADKVTIGFIGLGVMGEPICRNLAQKSGATVLAFDLQPAPLERLRAQGVVAAASVPEVAQQAGVVFVCLPSGRHVEAVCDGPARLRGQQLICTARTARAGRGTGQYAQWRRTQGACQR